MSLQLLRKPHTQCSEGVTREAAARAAWRESSSYAGMNRIKFAGLHLSTLGVHPGAELIVARGLDRTALRLELQLAPGCGRRRAGR